MSKAFTKDEAPLETLAETDPAALVPPGAVNYLTTSGLKAFQDELADLSDAPRSDEASARRARYLARLVEISRPLDPESQSGEIVRFGATVRVQGRDDREREYVIVGIHEADPARHRVSWNSPLGRALIGRQAGDEVIFASPGGRETLEILSVEFRALT